MGISRPLFFLVGVIWCSLEQGHSVSSLITAGSLPFRSSEASSPLTENFSECGKSKKNVSPHKLSIVGGNESELGDWPWMVALFLGSPADPNPKFFCAGSLISNQWIIIAAHCLHNRMANNIFARLGDLNINNQVDDGASPINTPVDLLVHHPEYCAISWLYDIALVRLRDSIPFTEYIRPICLLSGAEYKANEYYYGKQPYIVGWGQVNNESHIYDVMREVLVPVVEQKDCARQYANISRFVINEKVICAGKAGKGTCKGDSGDPLIFHNDTEKRFYLGGVLSGSRSCDSYHYPSRFTKIAQCISWINEITGNNC